MRLERPLIIGVVHLPPLPGSPRWDGAMNTVVDAAARDAEAYRSGGVHALVIENYHDIPFTRDAVPPETIAAMAVAAGAVRSIVGELPFGFNVLRNDARGGLGLCAACNGAFIRVNVHAGTMLTDQGMIQGEAYDTLRERKRLCPDVAIFADVHVKHATPLSTLEDAARDTLHRGLADGLIVSGAATGDATSPDDLKRVREACPEAFILVGSGATAESAKTLLETADGFIVGTAMKRNGETNQPVDPERVRAFMDAVSA